MRLANVPPVLIGRHRDLGMVAIIIGWEIRHVFIFAANLPGNGAQDCLALVVCRADVELRVGCFEHHGRNGNHDLFFADNGRTADQAWRGRSGSFRGRCFAGMSRSQCRRRIPCRADDRDIGRWRCVAILPSSQGSTPRHRRTANRRECFFVMRSWKRSIRPGKVLA